jgi:hypothetical protein
MIPQVSGASGIGEMDSRSSCDFPKMELAYKLAEEFRVPSQAKEVCK